MKKTFFTTLPLLFLSSAAIANQPVNTFISARVIKPNETTNISVAGQHYFKSQIANGVYDEFGYFDTDSSISAGYYSSDQTNGLSSLQSISGNYFHDKWLIGGSFSRLSYEFDNAESDTQSHTSVKLGYLVNDNLLVSALYNDDSGRGSFNAQYSHQLNPQGDYIGFSLSTNDDFDSVSLSSSYFGRLNGDNYIRLGFDHSPQGGDDINTYSGSYYFSEGTSVSLSSDLDLYMNVTGKHFISQSTAITISYMCIDDSNGEGTFQVGLTSQF